MNVPRGEGLGGRNDSGGGGVPPWVAAVEAGLDISSEIISLQRTFLWWESLSLGNGPTLYQVLYHSIAVKYVNE